MKMPFSILPILLLFSILVIPLKGYSTSGEIFEGYTMDLNHPLKYLEEEVRKHPDNPRLRFVLGALYFELGVPRYDEKKQVTQASLEMLNKAANEFKEVIKIKRDEPLAYYYLGHLAIVREANFKEAIEYYKKTIELDKSFLEAYKKLSVLYLSQKQYKEAALLLESAKSLSNSDADIYHKLAITYMFMQDYKKVIENEKKALSILKTSNGQLVLASAYSLTKDYEDAKIQLKDILDSDPKNKTALLGLSVVYNETGNKEKSIEILKRALEYYPHDPEVEKQLKEIGK
jgi:tetratricopeptide (TPR) repeat protein